jgi:hypothetical protein
MSQQYSTFTGALVARGPISGAVTVANGGIGAKVSASAELSAFASGPCSGDILSAINESQSRAGNLATPVEGYSSRLVTSDLREILDELFPPVMAGREFQYHAGNDDAAFTEDDGSDVRPLNASFRRIISSGGKEIGQTLNKGLTFRQDHDVNPSLRRISGWELPIVRALRNRLVRAELLRGIALLNLIAVNANVTFDATTNPDKILRDAVRSGTVQNGVRPTHLLIGDLAWQMRVDAYEDEERANQALAAHAAYDESDLARYLALRTVRREDLQYEVHRSQSKKDLLGAVAYIYGAERDALLDDPSNVKRVWSPCEDGEVFSVFIEDGGKYTDITVEHYSTFISPITSGVFKRSVV